MSLLKDRIATPDRLVNVKGLDGTISATPDGGLRIGAAVRLVDLMAHATVTGQYKALAEAAAEAGTPQIRNLGTVGGNLMQRPRCWYYRNEEFPCLKKGGARCYSVDGENQFHAILGGGPCHIVHPSSLAVPLVAFGAKVRIAGPRGEKEVLAEEFYELPERNLYGETALRARRTAHARDPAAGQGDEERHVRGALPQLARLADRVRDGGAADERHHGDRRARRARRRGARSRGGRRRPRRR